MAEEMAAARVGGERRPARTDEPMRVVCVVGLAHCNGVVDRLAAMDMERGGEVVAGTRRPRALGVQCTPRCVTRPIKLCEILVRYLFPSRRP